MQEYDAADKQSTYERIAELGPSDLAEDWRGMAEEFTSTGAESFDLAGQQRVVEHVEEVCGLQLEEF